MRKALFSFTFFIFSLSNFSCEIIPPQLLIILKKSSSENLTPSFQFKKCHPHQRQSLLELFNDYRGKINQRIIRSELKKNDFFLSQSFEIKTLSDLLNEEISLPSKWKIIELKPVGMPRDFISIDQKDSLRIQCKNCQEIGHKNIKLTFKEYRKQYPRILWLTASLAMETNVLISHINILPTNKSLSPQDFSFKKIYSSHPEIFFTQKKNLSFYKNTHSLRKGEPLRRRDLFPLNLVTAGQPVSLKLNAPNIKLQFKAIPLSSGHFGETISLKNPRSKKTILGKINNFNEVEIKL